MKDKNLYRIHFKEKETGKDVYTNQRALTPELAIDRLKKMCDVDVITKVKIKSGLTWELI